MEPSGLTQVSANFALWVGRKTIIEGPGILPYAAGVAALGAGCLTASIYRMTKRAQRLAWASPTTYRLINGPFVAPFGVAAVALGGLCLLPGFVAGMQSMTPDWFPGWISISSVAFTNAALPIAGIGSIGLLNGLRRISREKVVKSARGMAHWASWGQVRVARDWRWVLPMWVHYRGESEEWRKGAGRTLVALPANTAVRHILLVGQSGSAKGFGVFNPIIASSRVPFIYQDFKAETPGHEILQARTGLEPIRWGAAAHDGLPSMGFNPLQECAGDMNAIQFLAATLVPSRGSDDWVSQLARPILAWVLAHGGYQTLGDVYDELVQTGVPAVLTRSGIPGGLQAALEGKNVKEYLGTTIFAALAAFGSGWGREVTSRHEFSIADLFQRGGYVLSAEFDMARRVPLTMFWRFIIREITSSNQVRPLTLLFDEALAVGRIENVNVVLETARSKGIGVVFGIQHEDGLRREYREEADGLLSGFASRITLLNGLSQHDQDRLLKSLGNRVVIEKGADGKAHDHLVPLMTPDDLARRANQYERWWAVVDAVGATNNGSRILGQMVGAGFGKRPSAQEVEDEVRVCETTSGQDHMFMPTPALVDQANVAAVHGDEVQAALAAAQELEARAGWDIAEM